MLAAQFDTSGDTYLPALLNSSIHVLMYGHYFLTSIGVKNAPLAQVSDVDATPPMSGHQATAAGCGVGEVACSWPKIY